MKDPTVFLTSTQEKIRAFILFGNAKLNYRSSIFTFWHAHHLSDSEKKNATSSQVATEVILNS